MWLEKLPALLTFGKQEQNGFLLPRQRGLCGELRLDLSWLKRSLEKKEQASCIINAFSETKIVNDSKCLYK